jgi:hypothetical protein
VIGALLAQPALVSAPAGTAASAEMLALHAPEGLGLRLAEGDLDARVAPSSVMIER